MSQFGYGPPGALPQQPVKSRPVGMILVGVGVALLGALLNALFSFGMLFATDSCGTGSSGSSGAVCDSGMWMVLLALPWAGLLGGVLVTVLVAGAARRRGRSPWLGLAAGVALYAVACLISALVVFA